jgi:arylsulfatase A-like enzyme
LSKNLKEHTHAESVHSNVPLLIRGGLMCGLSAGVLEAVLRMLRHLTGRPMFADPRFVWQAPLVLAAVILLALGLLAALGRLWAPLRSTRLALLVMTGLATVSVLLTIPRLSATAVLLLTCGLAFQISRFLTPRLPRWPMFRIVPVVVTCVSFVLLAILFEYAERVVPRSEPAGTTRLKAPNLLLIVLDTVRASNLSLYGYARKTTPELERLATRGVTFDWAISTSSWTLPTHATLFTGRMPHELTVDWLTPLDATHPTLAEYLAARGYATAGFVANTEYCSREFGLARGFSAYQDFALTPGATLLGSSLVRTLVTQPRFKELVGYHDLLGRKRADRINRDALAWLSHPRDRPFFAFLNYYDAHDPYLPPESFATRFVAARPRGHLPVGVRLSPSELQERMDAYDGALAYLDHYVAQLLGELQRRDLLSNTVVLVTSDHGEEFGEHVLVGHGNSLYIESLHVPLLLVFPDRLPAGVRVASTVSLRDVATTVVTLLGLSDGAPFPGRSLGRYWATSVPGDLVSEAARSEVRESSGQPFWYPVMRGALVSLVAGDFQYIRNLRDGDEELFRIRPNAGNNRNVSNAPEHANVLESFRRLLANKSQAHRLRVAQ